MNEVRFKTNSSNRIGAAAVVEVVVAVRRKRTKKRKIGKREEEKVEVKMHLPLKSSLQCIHMESFVMAVTQ